jgi:hypothetical protein
MEQSRAEQSSEEQISIPWNLQRSVDASNAILLRITPNGSLLKRLKQQLILFNAHVINLSFYDLELAANTPYPMPT